MSDTQNKAFDGLKTVGLIVLGLVWYFFFSDGCGGSSSGGSIFSQECTFCSGSGKERCSTCSGTGHTNCTWCSGQGKQNCTDCSGSGKKNAYFPQQMENGHQYATYQGQTEYVWVWGNHYADFPCKKCSKSGKIECSNLSCEGGKIKCTWCNGEGEKSCTYCNGTGKD